MNDNYTYRPARAVDADQVHRLIAAVAEEEGSLTAAPDEISTEDIRDRIRSATNRRNRLFHVTTDSSKVVGMVALEQSPYRALEHIRFMSLAVDPRYRRQGVASELTQIALEWANSVDKVHKIEIQIRVANEAGLLLLQKAGFTIEGTLMRHTQLPTGKQVDDLLLARFVDNHARPQ
jgi:RimJ/RimL family protein N-acetyltransferase